MNPRQKALDEINKQQQNFIFGSSNPILGQKAHKIEPMKSANKLYGGYNSSSFSSASIENIDPVELLNTFCNAVKYKKSAEEIFFCLHNIATNQLNLNFLAIGFINTSLNSINLKISDKINNNYVIKISLDETQNPIIDAMNLKSIKFTQNIDFLNIYHLQNTPTIIVPLISKGEQTGVLLAGSDNLTNQKVEILKLLSEFSTIYMQNLKLNAVANQKIDEDLLTGLKNHRSFQDELQKQLEIAKNKSQALSVIIFDINDIARINRELGHAKGDEIIKYISKKIKALQKTLPPQ